MSHTDKDRPRWVMENDATLRRRVHHNHLLLGKPVYKGVYHRDPDGNPIFRTETYQRRVIDWLKAERAGYYTLRKEAERAEFSQVFWKDITSVHTGERRVYEYDEMLSYTYQDHCTAGAPTKRHDPGNPADLPCTFELDYSHNWWYGYGRSRPGVQRANRRIKNKRGRTHTRDNLKTLTKEVNAVEDYMDDVNYDRVPVGLCPVPSWADYD